MRSQHSVAVLSLFALLAGPSAAQQANPKYWVPRSQPFSIAVGGGRIYLGGYLDLIGPPTGLGVPLDIASGIPVSGFARVAAGVTGKVQAVVPDGAGGWYIGGEFDAVGGVPRRNAAHIAADGSVTAWDPSPD